MKKTFTFLIAVLGFMVTTYAQGDFQAPEFNLNDFPDLEIQDRGVADSLALWEERVYLHMDKAKAEAGGLIFFKAYVYNGPTQKRFSPSGVLRLELRDSENALVSTQYYPVESGAGEGVLRVPDKLKDGSYELLAYTRWMKNYGQQQFFRKIIQVGEVPEQAKATQNNSGSTLEFYPEGGRLLAGISNRVVFTSYSEEGQPQLIEGSIVDENGELIVDVQSYSEGYGLAIFQPEAGEAYWFQPLEGEASKLPEIQKEGYSLKVNSLSSEKIRIEVAATQSLKNEPVVLEGKRDNQSYFVHVLEFTDGKASLDILKNTLPPGMMTFQLSGMGQEKWAERPVWIDSYGELNIEAIPLSGRSVNKGRQGFRIKVTDAQGNPVQTDLSAAVSSLSVQPESRIDTYLKPVDAEMELRDSRSIRFLEDLKAQSMASQSGQRELPQEILYPVERGLELHGTAYDLDNVLLTNTEIQMLAASDDNLVIRELKTDASGVLHVKDLNVFGETQFIFRTKGEEQTERLVKLKPIRETAMVPKTAKTAQIAQAEVAKSKTYRKSQRKKPVVESTLPVAFDTTGVIQLKEATVVDKRKLEQELVPSLYGIRPNPKDVVYQDIEKPLAMDVLIRKIPGVQIRYTLEGVPAVYHLRRGGGSILWVVDGQVLRTGNDPYLSPMTFLTPLDILRVEFIIDAGQAAVFGVQAPTGVMIVYTRSGNFLDYVNRKEGGLYFKGYEPSLDFDAYMTLREEDRKLRKNPLRTLYWNPSVRTDKNGEAIIEYIAPEEFGPAVLSLETLTPDGKVGALRKAF